MSRNVRDSQRSRVYKAENKVFEPEGWSTTPDFPDWMDLLKYIEEVRTSEWYVAKWGRRVIGVGCSGRRRGACAWGTQSRLEFSYQSQKRWVVLHELAHLVTPDRKIQAHGWEFCQAYLMLVFHFLGEAKYAALKAEFKAHRVRFEPKRKSKSKGNPEALRAWRQRRASANILQETAS